MFSSSQVFQTRDGPQGTWRAWAEHPNAIHFLQPCVQPRCRCTLRTSLQAISQSWFSRPAFNPLLTALWLCSHFPFAGHQFVLALLPVRISPHNFQILAFLHLQGHSPPMLSSQVTTGEILTIRPPHCSKDSPCPHLTPRLVFLGDLNSTFFMAPT